jgi:hypothetical protein
LGLGQLVAQTSLVPGDNGIRWVFVIPWSKWWGVSSKTTARRKESGPNMAALTVHLNILTFLIYI